MGYFDGLVASGFKKDDSGRTLYYPFGIFGRGYVIPDDKKEKRIRSSLKLFYMISLPISIGTVIIFSWIYALLLLIPILLWAILHHKSLTKGLQPSLTKMKVSDNIDSSAKAHSRGKLWFLFIVGSLFTLMGLFVLISDPEKSIMAVLAITFFGVCTLKIGWMLLRKDKIDRSTTSFKYPMKNRSKRKWIIIFSIVVVSCTLFVLAPFILRTFVVQAFKIPAGSMKPTLLVGDHILVDKLPKNLDKIERGDIVVFIFPPDPRKDFVKRVIGLPNDLIEIRDKALYVNGELFQEDYVIHTDINIIPEKYRPRDNLGPIRVPQNSIFVLGDNRDASFDSRFWGFVDLGMVKGKVTKIFWSWDKENSQIRWDRIGETVR